MKVQEMNHVNLIGKMSSDPQVIETKEGRIVRFSLSTKETYLDAEGKTKSNSNWHRITAWGKWVPVLEQLGVKGQALAIEGRLCSRFFRNREGKQQSFTEIEINDLIIL